jgi:hypothetical protein
MSALEVSSFDKDELLSILDRFQCHRIPNTVEITDSYPHAHKAFIKEPKDALDAIKIERCW